MKIRSTQTRKVPKVTLSSLSVVVSRALTERCQQKSVPAEAERSNKPSIQYPSFGLPPLCLLINAYDACPGVPRRAYLGARQHDNTMLMPSDVPAASLHICILNTGQSQIVGSILSSRKRCIVGGSQPDHGIHMLSMSANHVLVHIPSTNRSTGLSPRSFIPLFNTCRAASYNAIRAFLISGSLPTTFSTS